MCHLSHKDFLTMFHNSCWCRISTYMNHMTRSSPRIIWGPMHLHHSALPLKHIYIYIYVCVCVLYYYVITVGLVPFHAPRNNGLNQLPWQWYMVTIGHVINWLLWQVTKHVVKWCLFCFLEKTSPYCSRPIC